MIAIGCRRLHPGALGAAAGLLAAATATWAQPAEDSTRAAAEAAQGHGPSILNVDPGLMIWTVVTFVLLLVVLRFLAWKPLLGALEAREQRIRETVEQAERARQESTALLAQHHAQLEAAGVEAQQILDAARADALRLQAEIAREAAVEAENFKQRALREVELATDEAKRQLWEEASRLSTELAERILRRSLDAGDHRRLVEEVLDEFRSVRPAGSD